MLHASLAREVCFIVVRARSQIKVKKARKSFLNTAVTV